MADEKQTGSDSTETRAPDPHVDDETRRRAEDQVAGLDDRYAPGARPTVVVPGTRGMVSGTAFADVVPDDAEDTSASADE
ncbi:hypothetical protein [Rhodococcoides kyotonense]|uniref:Uncharacterized protein n=1 Tax=Rhodococcoides kyotonense TaxID=398843 RepID=A0A239CVN2_9NOCA|nr:hypothetical protein [Rhodococcus kyotonensis]SNS24127.1 hypothetical protein SAMN05421642_101234 [Rhodococcus kyotonensis]